MQPRHFPSFVDSDPKRSLRKIANRDFGGESSTTIWKVDFSATTQLQMRPLARAIQRPARTPAAVSRAMIAESRRKSATDCHFAASFVYRPLDRDFPLRDSAPKCGTISLSKSLVLTRSQRVEDRFKLVPKQGRSAATMRNKVLQVRRCRRRWLG
jgi:hypothetical protein